MMGMKAATSDYACIWCRIPQEIEVIGHIYFDTNEYRILEIGDPQHSCPVW